MLPILDKILPSHGWEKRARDDLQRRLVKTTASIQSRFSADQIDGFLDSYYAWNRGSLGSLLPTEQLFIEEASKLQESEILALMLLLMDKMYPLPEVPSDADHDVP
jgi:hypothetical protein